MSSDETIAEKGSPAPPGDPRTRDRILRAAWDEIIERGASMTLGDVADRAGVSRQALYLHFGDREGLLLALVRFMPEALGFPRMLAHVMQAPDGVEMLRRTVALHSTYSAEIDPVAEVLEATQYRDPALGAAWRDRMNASRQVHRAIVGRIGAEGRLVDGWSVEDAGDLFYAVTMQGPWRELTRALGWTPERYAENMTKMLLASFVRTD